MLDGSFTSSPSKNTHNAQGQYLTKDTNEKEIHSVRLYVEKGINYTMVIDIRTKLLLTVTVLTQESTMETSQVCGKFYVMF